MVYLPPVVYTRTHFLVRDIQQCKRVSKIKCIHNKPTVSQNTIMTFDKTHYIKKWWHFRGRVESSCYNIRHVSQIHCLKIPPIHHYVYHLGDVWTKELYWRQHMCYVWYIYSTVLHASLVTVLAIHLHGNYVICITEIFMTDSVVKSSSSSGS